MGYITAAEVRTNIWKVTVNEVGNDFVEEAIGMAAADIDSALGGVYSVPFEATYPPVIVAINNALVRYYGQFITGHVFTNLHDPDQKAFDWAQEKLKALKAGTAIIPGLSRSGARVRCNTSGYHPTFDRDAPEQWGPDPDMLDEIADERD